MAKSKQITIPIRTSKRLVFRVSSGIEDIASYTYTLTVKKSVNLVTIIFTVDGTIDGTDIVFIVSADHSNIKEDTYKYDVIGVKVDERIPVCKGDMIFELWPSSKVE